VPWEPTPEDEAARMAANMSVNEWLAR